MDVFFFFFFANLYAFLGTYTYIANLKMFSPISRENSIMNHRSTMTQASIMRQGSTRIMVDRLPLRHANDRDVHSMGDEETNLVRANSRCNPRDMRRQSSVNKVITAKVVSSCKNNHSKNNNLTVNGAVSRV